MASNASWLNNYLPASFRGVPFFIQSHTYTSGRRNAEHQYPGDDRVEIEDLGKGKKRYKLSSYLVSDDYFSDRNQLIKALEQGGAGRLVHPYLGVLTVFVDGDFSASESTREGRMVRFDLTFISGENTSLVQVERNTEAAVASASANMVVANVGDFISKYKPDISGVAFVGDMIEATDKVVTTIRRVKRVVSSVARFTELLNAFSNTIVTLVSKPEGLGAGLSELIRFGSIPDDKEYPPAPEDSKEMIAEMDQLITQTVSEKNAILPSLQAVSDYPLSTMYDLVILASLATASGLVATTPLKTVEDGQALGELLFPLYDIAIQDPTVSEELVITIREMRRSVLEDLTRRISGLALIADVVLVETSSSLEIVYGVNGELSEEEDFVERNSVRHPGFVAGPDTVRVVLSE